MIWGGLAAKRLGLHKMMYLWRTLVSALEKDCEATDANEHIMVN